MICQACKKFRPCNRHHIKTRARGGTDDQWNMLNLCHADHMLLHRNGYKHFLMIYPEMEKTLRGKGWEITEAFGRFILTHPACVRVRTD